MSQFGSSIPGSTAAAAAASYFRRDKENVKSDEAKDRLEKDMAKLRQEVKFDKEVKKAPPGAKSFYA